MRLDKALEQISEIHEHLAKANVYRGYRAFPAALSGVLALVAALVQPLLVPSDPVSFVVYWTVVAIVAFLISVVGVMRNYIRDSDEHNRRRTFLVFGQLVPSLCVGVVVTIAFLVPRDKSALAFLPGIWALLYGLGLASSRPFLPRMIGWGALFYLLCGCYLLRRAAAFGIAGLSPWEVAFPFGVGQILGAAILYWNLERRNHG